MCSATAAKAEKSRPAIASRAAARSCGCCSTQRSKNGDVLRLTSIASVELTGLGPVAVIATTTCSGQSTAALRLDTETSWARFSSSTKPPYNDRAAEPEARPARLANSSVFRFCSANASAAMVSAANADAEDARPAAIGKLHWLVTRTGRRRAPSTVPRHRWILGNIPLSARPLTINASSSNVSSYSTHMVVYKSASVIEIEPTAGRLRSASRFPQYLINAIFGWALAVARMGFFASLKGCEL